MEITSIDVTDATFKANPFPFYAQLRTEAPVFPVALPRNQRTWLVTRYDDVLAVLKDERFVKDIHNAMPPEQLKKVPQLPALFKPFEQSLLRLDDPDHARLRVLVHKAFTPRRIEQMRDQVQNVTKDLLVARGIGSSRLRGSARVILSGDVCDTGKASQALQGGLRHCEKEQIYY